MAGRSRGDTMGGANLSPKQRAGAVKRRREEQRTARQMRDFWAVPGLLEQQRDRERDRYGRLDRDGD